MVAVRAEVERVAAKVGEGMAAEAVEVWVQHRNRQQKRIANSTMGSSCQSRKQVATMEEWLEAWMGSAEVSLVALVGKEVEMEAQVAATEAE
mmetsp:Transcript_14221/g.33862  ORF Transcript_14221/g.33862 Transcript_14221/m.33862 type:complete len:92 (+) Transcript_14221:159-434(+)